MADGTGKTSMTMTVAREAMSGPGSYFELGDEDVRGTTMTVFQHRAHSLRELLLRSARFGDRTYLVQDNRRLTYGEHLEFADALASILQEDHAIAPGDRVGIFAANRWEWVLAFWAVASAGGIPCAFNSFWTADEAGYATELVEPSLVLGDHHRLGRMRSIGIPLLDLDQVGTLAEQNRGRLPVPVAVAEDDPAVLIFTSGTTGRAKAVSTAHRSLCGSEQVNGYAEMLGVALMGGSVPRAGDDLPQRDDVVLITSPLFHTSMLYGVILRGVARGTTAVLLPGRFDPERVLRTIEQERVTSWLALGNGGPRVCAHPARHEYDTTSVEHVGIGGAPVSPTTQKALVETFPRAWARLSIGYSSTEAVSVVASLAGQQLLEHPTSTGRAAITVDIEIRDTSGHPVPEGELGEVHVRSPYLMLGYWNDPAATSAALKPGGWLAMGDLARLRDRLLYIEARGRDMILVNAENVSPTEVEHRLEAHPGVYEAAVFAVEDADTGDAVCAVVVADHDVRVHALSAWCKTALAHYKVPTRWHLVSRPLPRTASGKLMKEEIRSLVEASEMDPS
jgi:acyl-CoA synthetase (AMP-forming)/AMP-acid ligase II